MSVHETHPNSRKVYVGPYKVPVREITLSGGEPPMQVYDSSGPQGHDVREGLPPLRREWIAARGDVRVGAAHLHPRFEAARRAAEDAVPRGAARQRQRHAAPLRAQGRHHAGDGVHRRARRVRRRVRALGSGARPRDHPGQHQSPRARADDHRPQLPGEDQRQHRQLCRELVDRGRSREAAVGDPLGRGHGDGSLDRQGHPRDARVDSAEFAGADRHGARSIRRSRKSADGRKISRGRSIATR